MRESTIILDAIRQWLDSEPLGAVLPKSDFAEAAAVPAGNHWQALNVYVRDGRLPIDNNSVEQLMKQVAMGRKALAVRVQRGRGRAKREDDDLGEQRKTA